MQVMQVVNMFGAIRAKEREKPPYGVSRQSVVPTKDEAKVVLESLSVLHENDEDRQEQLNSVRSILNDLSEGNSQTFLALSEDEFEDHNDYIAESLAMMQIDLLEQQARAESNDFKAKNAIFFDELREEGLNYDHLSEEQIEVMRLRLRERGITEKFEKNANRVEGEVFYQYSLGPDDRYYKTGGLVIGSASDEGEVTEETSARPERELAIDDEVVHDVLKESAGEDNLGQFADVDAFSMPSARKRRRSV